MVWRTRSKRRESERTSVSEEVRPKIDASVLIGFALNRQGVVRREVREQLGDGDGLELGGVEDGDNHVFDLRGCEPA